MQIFSSLRIRFVAFSVIFISVFVIDGFSQEFNWTPQSSGTNQWLNDIYFTDPLNGWAVGTNGAVVATSNGGETWIIQTSGTDQELRSVFFLNQDTGWIAGGTDGAVILATEDGGASWSSSTIDIPGITYLKEIQFADPFTGFVTDTTDIFQTIDGGLTWEKSRYSSLIIDIIQLEGLYVLPEGEAFACGFYHNKSNEELPGIFENLTLPGGQWLSQDIGLIGPLEQLSSLHFSEAMKGFAGSSNGRIYSMQEEDGIFPGPWTLNFESGKGRVTSIAFSTDMHGMFSASSDEDNEIGQFIFHTADSGTSWSTAPDMIVDLHMASLTAPDVNHAWIAGNNGIIYKGERDAPVSALPQTMLELSIHPNPFSSLIVIESPEALRNVSYELFDYTGKSVRSGLLDNAGNRFTITGLESIQSGVYFLRVKTRDGLKSATKKLIK
jgi:photosystem II stability/assembly factor-like uncharacterized protein